MHSPLVQLLFMFPFFSLVSGVFNYIKRMAESWIAMKFCNLHAKLYQNGVKRAFRDSKATTNDNNNQPYIYYIYTYKYNNVNSNRKCWLQEHSNTLLHINRMFTSTAAVAVIMQIWPTTHHYCCHVLFVVGHLSGHSRFSPCLRVALVHTCVWMLLASRLCFKFVGDLTLFYGKK